MDNLYQPSSINADQETPLVDVVSRSSVFWWMFFLIAVIGVTSVVGRQWGSENSYGVFGGYGHFPIVWLGGFTVYPGYFVGLLSFGGGDWILCFLVTLFILAYYLGTIWLAFRNRAKNSLGIFAISYFISLGLNFFNFIFVGLLHV